MAGRPTRNRCNYEWFAQGQWKICTRGKGHGSAHDDRRSKTTCSIEGCLRLVVALGFCDMHYRRQRKHGDAARVVIVPVSDPMQCKVCKQLLPLSSFPVTPNGTGLAQRRTCRVCKVAKKYGITANEYNALGEKQGWVCAICFQPETTRGSQGQVKSLAIDHDKDTNKIRGLLCAACNTGIGCLSHDTSILQQAIVYLGGKT